VFMLSCVLPYRLQYLTNAKDLISSSSVMSKPTLYGLNLERRILDKFFYEVDSSDIPR
jgi:hypothetical protein